MSLLISNKIFGKEIKVTIEYSETKEKLNLIISFSHEVPDLLFLKDTFPIKIIKGNTSDIRRVYTEGAKWPGQIILTISD